MRGKTSSKLTLEDEVLPLSERNQLFRGREILLYAASYMTKVLFEAAVKVNADGLIDCLDAKPKVTPSCDCGALFTCPIVEGIQASESLP